MALDNTRRRLLFACGGAALGAICAVLLAAPRALAQGQAEETITVSGCLERDAASRVVVYKLIAKDAQYRLTAPSSINLEAELGHTIEVTDTLTRREGRGRDDAAIAVRAMKKVSDSCS